MGISKSLWREACVAMGRECAAVAVVLVSAKPAAHFRTSPGGYFHGMVTKAKAGELNLMRTIWGLRQAKASKQRGTSGRARGPASGKTKGHEPRLPGPHRNLRRAPDHL
jgi:replication initiation protein RepC